MTAGRARHTEIPIIVWQVSDVPSGPPSSSGETDGGMPPPHDEERTLARVETTSALARVEVDDRLSRFAVGGPGLLVLVAGVVLLVVGRPWLAMGTLAATSLAGGVSELWLKRWLRASRHRAPTNARLAAIERLAHAPWATSKVRRDAAGWLALLRLERGDSQGALAALGQDALYASRWRSVVATGLAGEAIRAIVARLFPEQGWKAIASRRVRGPSSPNAPLGFDELAGLLAVLEASDAGDRHAVRLAWAELPATTADAASGLTALVLAAATEVEPTLASELSACERTLTDPVRRMLREYVAARGLRDLGGYRAAAALPPEPRTALAIPPSVRGIQVRKPRVMALIGLGGLTTCGIGMGGVFLPSVIRVWVAPMIAAWLAVALWERYSRQDAVLGAGVLDPRWRSEVSRMRNRSGGLSWPGRASFTHGDLMLIGAVHRAERALLEDDRDGARECIGWWLDNVSRRELEALDTVGLGAALLRLAALLDVPEATRQMMQRPSPRRRRGLLRSGHGDAPRAMALARAVVQARRGDWQAAAAQVAEARARPGVRLEGFDIALYGALLDALAERGHEVPRKAIGLPRSRHASERTLGWAFAPALAAASNEAAAPERPDPP